MRQFFALCALLCPVMLWAQFQGPPAPAPAPEPLQVLESKEIDLAKAEIDRIADLVASGALPRNRLEEAEEKLADAQDDAILAHTLYGELPVQNLSEQMADEMVAAAQRRLEREINRIAASQKLVNEGVLPRGALEPLQEELNMRSMNLNLAHSRAKLIGELANIARYEHSMQALQSATRIEPYTDYTLHSMVHYEGNGIFLANQDLHTLETSFQHRFGYALPVSADGQTAVHDALHFDHHGRVDVAVNPNQPEGIWLRHYLEAKRIPYYAFLRAIPGKATGAHIHIGPGSTRLHNAD
jgi:hypothetical protein